MKDYYAILEVPPTASQEEIREQYLLLIQAWHPDKFPNPAQKTKAEEKCKEINLAYGVLKDIQMRAEYDRKPGRRPSSVREEEKQRRTEGQRPHKQAQETQQRTSYERQQRERAEGERRRSDHEADNAAQEEWIRVFFEQARRRKSKQPPAEVNKSHHGPIRVLVVDDLADTRLHIRQLLGSDTDIRVVGEASDGVDAIEKFRALMPDVTTICINMPTMDGITATEAIRRKYPLAKVIMISAQNSTGSIRRAMMAGACDFLIKPPQAMELQAAIRLAAGREISASA